MLNSQDIARTLVTNASALNDQLIMHIARAIDAAFEAGKNEPIFIKDPQTPPPPPDPVPEPKVEPKPEPKHVAKPVSKKRK